MKLKERLALTYRLSQQFTEFDTISTISEQSFLIGFEAAKKLAIENFRPDTYAISDDNDMRELGEEDET